MVLGDKHRGRFRVPFMSMPQNCCQAQGLSRDHCKIPRRPSLGAKTLETRLHRPISAAFTRLTFGSGDFPNRLRLFIAINRGLSQPCWIPQVHHHLCEQLLCQELSVNNFAAANFHSRQVIPSPETNPLRIASFGGSSGGVQGGGPTCECCFL